MNLRNLLCALISLGVILGHTGPIPSFLWFGDYPYPEES